MTLDQIVTMAIPILSDDCNLKIMKKNEMRVKMKERIIAWVKFEDEARRIIDQNTAHATECSY